jgi:hypothetical protein
MIGLTKVNDPTLHVMLIDVKICVIFIDLYKKSDPFVTLKGNNSC